MRRFMLPLLALLTAGPAPADDVADEPPPPPQAATVELGEDALSPLPRFGRFLARIEPDPGAADRPVIAPDASDSTARTLNAWVAQGTAAGLAEVFYDNRDRGHSRLSRTRFPQLTHIRYDPELMRRDFDRSLARQVLFPRPTLGNASLAVTSGAMARSLPRLAMTAQGGPAQAFVGYIHNHLYVYPAHRDVRDIDKLPALLPYFVASVGSSGSDRPFLDALALTLASFRPDTRARLEAEGLIAPTLDMILRRSLQGVTDYASPPAHPPAFRRQQLRPAVMMAAAQAMAPSEIPPLVILQVEQESFSREAGLSGSSEQLFDTPSAIARVWRGWDWRREMVVSAADTRDPNGRELEFRWVLLSGDPDRVRIEPLDPSGVRARLVFDWHDAPFALRPGATPTARVAVAALAWNGAQWSAPATVSVAFPAHEHRRWESSPGNTPRLAEVDYAGDAGDYGVDPAIWWRAPWRDEAVRDGAGRLLAWRRHLDGQVTEVPAGQIPHTHRIDERRDGTRVLLWEPR
jgi:hypothetical protein